MKYLVVSTVVFIITGCTSVTNFNIAKTEYGKFTYYKTGQQNPTVVLESGLGDNMTSWDSSIKKIDKSFQIFAYNRAGYSGSGSLNKERNAKNIVAELRELLHQVNVSPPYILVGHSLGGLYMQLYAKSYPEEVFGIVLVDSTHAGKEDRCKNTDGSFCEPPDEIPWWARAVLPNAVSGEYKSIPTSMEQVRKANDFPPVPLVVLSRGKNPWEDIDNIQDWQKQRWLEAQSNQKDLATLSPISKQIVCLSCGHYVHQDKPELINDAILWILDKR